MASLLALKLSSIGGSVPLGSEVAPGRIARFTPLRSLSAKKGNRHCCSKLAVARPRLRGAPCFQVSGLSSPHSLAATGGCHLVSRRYNYTMWATFLTNRNALQGLISFAFGLLVLMFPKLLNYLIAFYFIITGLTLMLPFLK